MSFEEDWSRCAPWLQRALDRGGTQGFALDEVRRRVTEGGAHFWPGQRSAGVSEVTRDFHIWLFGGELTEMWAMERAVSDWSRANGLSRVTIKGRKGWERVLAPIGYRAETLLVKDL